MNGRFFLPVFLGGLVAAGYPAGADAPVLPGAGFAASRYEVLWTKSPFAVASAEGGQESPDYALKGIAQFDGISYASLIDKRSPGPEPEHFLLSSDKPVKGLTLVSVTRGHDSSGTFAVIQKDGQLLTLKLEVADANQVAAANNVPAMGNEPAVPMPGIFRPGSGAPPGVMRRQRLIHIPPNPPQPVQVPQSQPPPAPLLPGGRYDSSGTRLSQFLSCHPLPLSLTLSSQFAPIQIGTLVF